MCEYNQCRIWTERSHIGGSCTWSWKLGRSWQDLGKIIVRSFSSCNIVVVCICYDLICSLDTLCDCATCMLTELVVHKLWITKLEKKQFVHVCPSIAHVHLLSVTQLLMRNSFMCNVVCLSPGQPTNYLTGIPGMAHLP